MAFDEQSAQRLRDLMADHPAVSERKMMGGLIFMVKGHMCCGITGDALMVRVGADAREKALARAHVFPLDIGAGRTPSAFVCVGPDGYATKQAMRDWVQRALDFVETLPAKR